jgi:hypothetical protein
MTDRQGELVVIDPGRTQRISSVARPRWIPALAWLAAAALVALGVLCIGTYVHVAVDVWGESDKSMLFWTAFLPVISLPLLTAGGFFAAIGSRARRGDPASVSLARNSLLTLAGLIALMVFVGAIVQHRAAKERHAFERTERLQVDRRQHARTIRHLELRAVDDRRLLVRADLSDGLDGRYRWTLTLATAGTALHRESGQLELRGQAGPFVREWPFDAVFASCFATPASPAYACAKGAEATDLYSMTMALDLVGDARDPGGTDGLSADPARSTAAADLRIDTRTTQDRVVVMSAGKP